MPGDDRKFRRRTIVAFIPICNRAREIASQTFLSAGISTIGVGNVSGTGGSVGDGSGEGVSAGRGVTVPVGDGVAEGVAVGAGDVDVANAVVGVEGSGVNVIARGWG